MAVDVAMAPKLSVQIAVMLMIHGSAILRVRVKSPARRPALTLFHSRKEPGVDGYEMHIGDGSSHRCRDDLLTRRRTGSPPDLVQGHRHHSRKGEPSQGASRHHQIDKAAVVPCKESGAEIPKQTDKR